MKLRDSTMRTLLLDEIVCFAGLIALGLIQFDPPLSLVSIGGFAVAIGALPGHAAKDVPEAKLGARSCRCPRSLMPMSGGGAKMPR